MPALKVSAGAPVLADPQAGPRAERLATVGAENVKWTLKSQG